VYTGNVHDPEGQSTCCPACGQLAVGREGYDITTWRLDSEGRCRECKSPIPGVFEGRAGAFGSRRIPVMLGGKSWSDE
jgi:pyruvate formate lyase activating enzyme